MGAAGARERSKIAGSHEFTRVVSSNASNFWWRRTLSDGRGGKRGEIPRPAGPSGTQKARYAAGRAELRREKEARPLRSE